MSNFTLPLGIESLEITPQTLDNQGNIIFDVKSNKTSTRCRICGKSISKVHRAALKLTHIFNTHQSRKVAFTKLNRWIDATVALIPEINTLKLFIYENIFYLSQF